MASPPTAHQTLYRKYRSQTFADLVGQDVIARALQGAIAADHLAHAYLFSGTRGTGKTSTARLVAKAVNCSGRAPGASEPCNSCPSCVGVMAGTALDLIEVDAASNRGIDEIRDLREKVHLAPAMGKRKVYIIDEAHMLTTEAFNALLKTLEEPPEHALFILCTTESQKLPMTVLGRCQHFVFRRHEEQQVVARLTHIALQERTEVEAEALALIARTAQGSLRDAIGLLDQVIPMSGGKVTAALTRELLGIADPALLDLLLTQIESGSTVEALASLGAIYEGGGELRQLVRGLLERVRDRLVEAVRSRDDPGRVRLAHVLDVLLHLDGEVRRHAEPRFLVEATIVRLSAEVDAPAVAVSSPPPPVDVSKEESLAETAGPPVSSPSMATDTVERAPLPSPPVEPAGMVAPDQSPVDGNVDTDWRLFLNALKPNVKAILREARPRIEATTLYLSFRYGFHHQWARDNKSEYRAQAQSAFGTAVVEVELATADPLRPTVAPLSPEEHPLVQETLRQLEGRVSRVREVRS